MEEKEKVEATASQEEEKDLTEEEEEASIHWKTAPNRPVWTPADLDNPVKVVAVEPTPEEEEETRQMLEETSRRAEEVPEEELHPAYKKMIAVAPAAVEGEKEEEGEKIAYAKCGECGEMVPYTDLHDNGSYVVCSKCY